MLTRIVLRDAAAARWLIFADPLAVLAAHTQAEVSDVLCEAERRVADEGLFAAGYVTYEAARGFDDAFATVERGPLPLLCFGLFSSPRHATEPEAGSAAGRPCEWSMSGSRGRYTANVERIRKEIAAGNTYQVNYTVRQHASGLADARDLFVRTAADAPYAALVEGESYTIVSASPELFFDLDGERIVCKPMKGTAPRGMWSAEDRRMRNKLQSSAKDRAENVMIVDMVRNDLGRIAEAGTVRAESLFDIEKYRTVWQMTSTVAASTPASVTEIFRALFPSASITGAPKVASMNIIAELEESPRRVYTGAIGFIGPGRQARFNVAIRTAVIDRNGNGTYGVGGGIVWDSDPDDEYQECLNKARILTGRTQHHEFQLLETLLWEPDGGYRLLDEHLERLTGSAGYFDFAFELRAVVARLESLVGQFAPARYRVRLLLSRDGAVTVESRLLDESGTGEDLSVRLADHPVDPSDAFLYHKTTERSVYESALAAAGNCDDVLLWNSDGFVTESTVANLVVRDGENLYTPPVDCGLLPGTLREKLLRDGVLEERGIRIAELAAFDELFLVNSVRGFRRCRLRDGQPRAAQRAGSLG